MGNTNSRQNNEQTISVVSEDNAQSQVRFQEVNVSSRSTLFGWSFFSLHNQESQYSLSRPWSSISRRRWRESTNNLQYQSRKTTWPVSRLELYFLPTFPVKAISYQCKYKIEDQVAKGAFGVVYKAYCSEEKKYFALKVLSKSQIIKESAIEQVKQEVQIQSACGHHEFIVNSSQCWQTKKKLYIVSDFVEGGELYNLLILYGILPSVLVKLYVAQIALVLDFLHNAGVIYRDLKPENLLLDERGDLHLIDFGFAKWLPYGNKTKTLCGTLRYMGMTFR